VHPLRRVGPYGTMTREPHCEAQIAILESDGSVLGRHAGRRR
jgi:hypothetical protein